MRIFQTTKRVLKPLVDFPTWMGYRILVDNGKAIVQDTKDLFIPPPPPERSETFEEAITRLGLTEEGVKKQERAFWDLALVWGIIAVGMLFYTIWLLITSGFAGALLTAALTFFSTVLTFRYHFWYFQVKNRTLGVTFKQWLQSCLRINR